MRKRGWSIVPRTRDEMKGALLPTAIASLRTLPPSDPAKVDQIVAAAMEHGRASASEVMLPDGAVLEDGVANRPALRPSHLAWWQIGVVGIAAVGIFGVGVVAGHTPWLQRATTRAQALVAQVTAGHLLASPSASTATAPATVPLATERFASTATSGGAGDTSPVPTTFQIRAPYAHHVALVGDFNAWNPTATMLQRTADSTSWKGVVDLVPGRHTYTFLVDGKVIPDPQAVNVRDPDYDVIVSTVVVKGGESQ